MSSTRDDIVYDCNKDVLIDNVNDAIVILAEAVVWLIPLIVADLDSTGVVAGFGITFNTNHHTARLLPDRDREPPGDPDRGEPGRHWAERAQVQADPPLRG